MLEKITIGWRWLNDALNAIIDEVNRQKPLPSVSIAVEESPNGSLLKVVNSVQSDGGGGLPSGGQWCTLAVIDTSSGTCVTKTLTYWGTPPQ